MFYICSHPAEAVSASMRMCGKYGGPADMAVHAGYLKVSPPFQSVDLHKEHRPMTMVTVWAKNAEGFAVLKEMRWGLIPWDHTGKVADWTASTFHARMETVATTKSYARSWALKRRVLFPMKFFSERNTKGLVLGRGVPERIPVCRSDTKPLGIAGIYDHAHTADGPVLSVAMLTRAPGPRMRRIHDREPVVIEPEHWQAWLDGADDLDLMTPWADDAFEIGTTLAIPHLLDAAE